MKNFAGPSHVFQQWEVSIMRVAALTALLGMALVQGCGQGGEQVRHEHSRTFQVAEGTLIRVELRSHDVHLKVGNGDTVTIRTELVSRAGSARAATRWVEANTPTVDHGAAGIHVRLPAGSGRIAVAGFSRTVARVTLTVPLQSALDITTSSGDVSVTGSHLLAAPLRVRTTSGDLSVQGGVRELIFRTSSGDARIEGSALDRLEVKTSSGDVRLRSGSRQVLADTGAGDLRLRGLTGAASVRSGSGDIRLAWAAWPGEERIAVQTTSGNVELTLPAGPVHGSAQTRSGRLQSAFPGEPDPRGRRMVFSAPEPGVELEITTASGTIRLQTSPHVPAASE